MKLQQPKEYFKIWGPPPLISYQTDVTIGKRPTYKSDSLKFNINIQPGDRYNDTVAIYVQLFQTGSPDALLKFLTLLHKIIRDQDLSTGPQRFGMTSNLVDGEAMWVFKEKAQERWAKKKQIMSWLWRTSSTTSFPQSHFSSRRGT